MTQLYLDYNASAPLHPLAFAAMAPFLRVGTVAHNASATHKAGQAGRKAIEEARNNIAALINADSNQIIFNSGATEGNNTVLRFFEKKYPNETILVGASEHSSIINAAQNIQAIPVDNNGIIDIGFLTRRLTEKPKVSLVSIMLINNETGVIQNVSDVSRLIHKYGALLHCDATQGAGRIAIDMKAMGIDFLSLSSHKIGGPQGVGALALGLCGITPTLIRGGGQEKGARAGTENVAGIAGFGGAAKAALDNLGEYKKLSILRDKLEHGLKDMSSNIIIHCENANRAANTSFFSLPDANTQMLLIALDLENIAISSGSACSSGTVKPSHVLKAMGVSKKIAASALRVSIGWATKESDIDEFLKAWKKITERMK